MQPESNTDLITWVMDNFNFRYIGLGIAGGTIGMLRRKRKNGWESFFMVLVGTVCAAVFTDPIHAYWELKQPDFANLKGIRDALAVVVASTGWSLIRLLIIELPRFVRRWALSQAEFIQNEAKNSKDDEKL